MSQIGKKLLFVVTEDRYFLSHRLKLATSAIEAGFTVGLITKDLGNIDKIISQGIQVYPIEISRKSLNPLSAFLAVLSILKVFWKFRPDIVHNISLKPIIFSNIAAKFFPKTRTINLITGLGFSFSSDSFKARIVKAIFSSLFSTFVCKKNAMMVFQNPDDQRLFMDLFKLQEAKTKVILGSGVDTLLFAPKETTSHENFQFLMASRITKEKGVEDYIEASKLLKRKGYKFECKLAGRIDREGPSSISEEQVKEWQELGLIEWLGLQHRMSELINDSDAFVFPSKYREGVPKCLIEAASCGKPIVTSNSPGCREIVIDGFNGLLHETGNVTELAKSMEMMMISPETDRIKYSINSRQHVLKSFSDEVVIAETLKLYR